MSDHERGAYTPPTADAPLSFDARQPVRGARPVPFTLIISVVVLAALVAAIFVFYRSGVREAGQPPATVGAPLGEMKSAAPPEAQPQDPAAGLQIYRSEGAAADTPPNFVPPPEEPQPRPAPTTPVVVSPPAQPAMRPALPAAPPAQKAAAPPPAPKAAETKVAAPAAPAPAATGGAAVQIGAVSSTALADRAWNEAVAVAPGLAAGKGKSIEGIERDGSVLYRTAVTGFASRDEAAAFCSQLKAAGKNCFVR